MSTDKEKPVEIKPNDEELLFVEKPLRKPDSRIYGRLEKWKDSEFQQFVPTAVGSGKKREVLKSSGRAKLVKNEGEKESSYSLLVSHDAKDDQFADRMIEDVMGCLKDFVKKEVKLPNAKFLHDDDAIKVWKSKERGRLVIHAELDSSLDKTIISKEWSRISYEISKIIFQTNLKKK